VLVRKLSSVPVTGSITVFFSEGNVRPTWAEAEAIDRAAAQSASDVFRSNLLFIWG
jgi:hypothetical protein